jgi:cysteinyl-tRNA synthetase
LLDKLYNVLAEIKDIQPSQMNEYSIGFVAPLLDDLNTPSLLANLNKMIKDFGSISHDDLPEFKSKLILATKLMGICQEDYQDWFSNNRAGLDIDKIEKLISQRLDAKKNKEFDKADAIRKELLEMSIEIKDTESGTDWNLKT